MRNKVICDWCLNVINDDYDEVPIIILELDIILKNYMILKKDIG